MPYDVDPSLVDVVLPEHDGYPEHLAVEDTRDALMMAAAEGGARASTDFPPHLFVEPNRWEEMAKENDANKTWGMDYLDRFTNQQPTHECTCHSLRANFEAARNRTRRFSFGGPLVNQRNPLSGESGSVWVSPLSIYAEANPSIRGGANVIQVLRIAAKRGFLPETLQPRDYGFKHAIVGTQGKGGVNQSSGDWVRVSNFPSGWEETAKHFKPLEFVFPEEIEQVVSLLLHGFLVSVGRDGHAIPYGKYDFAQKLFPYTDSYDVIRYDSYSKARGCVDGSFSIVSTTIPDDWDKPVG